MAGLFFSEKLMRKIGRIPEFSLTAVEAPAGYGKTTAVRNILRNTENTQWYIAIHHMTDFSFNWFIHQIGYQDEVSAKRLRDLGRLNCTNAAEAARIIAGIRLKEPLTLVFDNFQFSMENWQPQVIDMLAKRPDGLLRTVFISQHFGRLGRTLTSLEDSICYATAEEFLLSASDIHSWANIRGIDLNKNDARELKEKTNGWAVAVALCLQTLEQKTSGGEGGMTGGLPDDDAKNSMIDGLLNMIFWKKLPVRIQKTFLAVCQFDHMTPEIAEKLLRSIGLFTEDYRSLMGSAPLVTIDMMNRTAYMHEILVGFLQRRLEHETEEFRRNVYITSGSIYQEMGRTKEAIDCYFKAGDYEAILSCRLVCLITETFSGISYTELAREVLENCPQEILKEYPLSCLRLCYALYAGCDFDGFAKQMERIRVIFDSIGDNQLIGEWTLMSAFMDFPDLDAMVQKATLAEELMERTSEVFIREEPFMFGSTSMWYLFFREPGAMMRTADQFESVMEVYNRLTNGHGAGAAEIYRGECLSVQGLFEESDIQAFKAAFLAEQADNVTIVYGVALLLGINAIYRSDMIELQRAIEYLEKKAGGYSFMQGKSLNTYMMGTVRGYLMGLMLEPGSAEQWAQGKADTLAGLTFTNFMVKSCRIMDLLLKKEYKIAIASVEASLGMDERLISTATKNFMYCGLALCYLSIGRPQEAAKWLDKSLTLVKGDKNYTYLASFRKYFQPLFLMPDIAEKHAEAIQEILSLEIHYTRADESHIFDMLEDAVEAGEILTEREQEVARLAADGMRNAEIAAALFISENTVKHHLKSIFQKMNIDRRSKLVEMLK